MLETLRRWFRRPAAPPPLAPAPRPVPPVVAAPAVVEPVEAPPAAETAPAAFPAGQVAEHLRSVLAQRIADLRESLAPAERGGDAGDLLALVQASDEGVIRQLPEAAQAALAVCNDPNAGLQQLVPLFMKDPTLTQALLKMANSAYYGGWPIVSLGDAMQRVGTGGVRSVLLQATVQGLLCRPGGVFAPMVGQTWEHMGRTAPIARAIAGAFDENPDDAFALGLLHDVGKLVLFDAATALRADRKRELRFDPGTVRAILGTVHEPLGGLAVLRWGLGDRAAMAVATHHRSPIPAWRDGLGETLHVAEKADLTMLRGVRLDCEALWAKARLTGNRGRVQAELFAEY